MNVTFEGKNYTFPDDATDDEISSALEGRPTDEPRGEGASMILPEQPGDGNQLLRQAGLAARYGVEGLTALPAMVGNAANSTVNLGIKGVNSIAGTNIPYLQKPTDMISQGLTEAGVPQPETATERIISYPSKALAGTGVTALAGKAVQQAPGAIKGLADLAKGLWPQAAGATTGGIAQGTTAEVTDNPLLQILAGFTGGAAGGAVAGRVGQNAQAASIPTTRDLKTAAQAQFQAADGAGAVIRPEPLQSLAANIRTDLAEFGYHPALQPRVGTVLQELDRISVNNITTKGMMDLRRIAQNAAKSADPSEQAIGSRIISQIDDFMTTLGPDDVVQGDVSAATSAWQNGRSLWSQFRKSETVENAVTKAERQTASTGSGGNIDNALRQKFKSILDSEKARRGFNSDELAAMEAIVRGTAGANALRLIGKLSPQGNGLMAALGLGATVANPAMAAFPVAGMIAKPLADRATRSNVNALSELIRTGGRYAEPSLPAANQALPNALMGVLPNAVNTALPPDKRALVQRLMAQ